MSSLDSHISSVQKKDSHQSLLPELSYTSHLEMFSKSLVGKNQVMTLSVFDIPMEFVRDYCSCFVSKLSSQNDDTIVKASHTAISNISEIAYGNSFNCRRCGMKFNSWDEQKHHFKGESHINTLRSLVRTEYPSYAVTSDPLTNSSDIDLIERENCSESDIESDDDDVLDNEGDIQCMDEISKTSIERSYHPKFGSQWVFRPSTNAISLSSNSFALTALSISLSTVLLPKDLITTSRDQTVSPWEQLFHSISKHQNDNLWTIFLFKSGKFAGGVFQGKTCIVHKVLKRYTVRAKAGGSQSSFDNKFGKARSAGAMMRRQGEQALKEDIKMLLLTWSEHIRSSSLILMSVPKTRRSIFFDDEESYVSSTGHRMEGPLIKKDDDRVRFIPFAVDNPTYEEITRVHTTCSSLTFQRETNHKDNQSIASSVDQDTNNVKLDCDASDMNGREKKKESSIKILTASDIPQLHRLFEASRGNDVSILQSALSSLENIDVMINIPENEEDLFTSLHIASVNGGAEVVLELLRRGADPCKRDIRGRVPYNIAKDKDTRDSFRKYRGECESNGLSMKLNTDADEDDVEEVEESISALKLTDTVHSSEVNGFKSWDWIAASIPSALTDEIEKQKREKEKEKKKIKNKASKQKKLEKKKESKIDMSTASISIPAEIVVPAAKVKDDSAVCDACGNCYHSRAVYEVYDRKVCSSECVLKIRRRLAADAAEKRAAMSTAKI